MYWVAAPVGSGKLIFEDPKEPDMLQIRDIKSRNSLSFTRIGYEAEERKILIFRSYLRHMVEPCKNKTPRMTIFGADQSPTYSKNVHWTNFLNQDTAVALGTERFAKKYNLPVVFCSINKEKRGIYSAELSVLTENPQDTEDGEITEMHTSKLENQINVIPEFWLWTHKRWKRKR